MHVGMAKMVQPAPGRMAVFGFDRGIGVLEREKPMRLRTRLFASIMAGLVVGLALMAHDRARDVGWAVTAAQIADARASGQPGVALGPGRYATAPIPAEDAWLLPIKWLLVGLGAGFAVLAGTGLRRPPGRGSDLAAREPRRIPPDRRT
jgi:hypothetical protein